MEDHRSQVWTENLLAHFRELVAEARSTLTIFSPFMSVEALKAILSDVKAESVEIVTVWSAQAVRDGSADLGIYPYAKSVGARVYLLPHLHMKVIIADRRHAVVSTANITGRGVGMIEPPNIECAALVNDLDVSDQLWFVRQLRHAMLVQDDHYLAYCQFMENQDRDNTVSTTELFQDETILSRQQFLIDALPKTRTPEALLAGILRIDAEGTGSIESRELDALLHDAVRFGLEPGCGAVENWRRLRENFLNQRFVAAFLESLEGRRYFGEAKAWLQTHCADIPKPPRKQLTTHTRILFDWISSISEGEIALLRPQFSECLVRNASEVCVGESH